MITYNHEKFIEQAILGVLTQKTRYSFELIIGDDGSSDNTVAICKRIAERFPSKIRLLSGGEARQGMMTNFIRTMNACKGKYIALCDGDDYWTDFNKLQKQVNFLETNPDFSICCHRVYIKKNEKKPKLDNEDIYAPFIEATYDIEMMARHGNLIATPSVVFRNNLFIALPAWFDRSPIADYILHMMNAQHGKIKYLPDAMAVYRDHPIGAWGGQSVKKNAAGMMKVIEFLLTESFDTPVIQGLKSQLLKHKATYLNELMREDMDLFYKEFDVLMENDKSIVMELIGKMKTDTDILQQSRSHRFLRKIKNVFRK